MDGVGFDDGFAFIGDMENLTFLWVEFHQPIMFPSLE